MMFKDFFNPIRGKNNEFQWISKYMNVSKSILNERSHIKPRAIYIHRL